MRMLMQKNVRIEPNQVIDEKTRQNNKVLKLLKENAILRGKNSKLKLKYRQIKSDYNTLLYEFDNVNQLYMQEIMRAEEERQKRANDVPE